MRTLTAALAGHFARIALGHVTREFPHKLDHVLDDAADAQRPRALHPIFHGSFDWHSCVHGYWLLLRLLRRVPQLPEATSIVALADRMFTPIQVAGELAYLQRPTSGAFERPYGWAWLLALHAESAQQARSSWASALEPLARAFAARLRAWLSRLDYPVRSGAHYNSAFALVLARTWACGHDAALLEAIDARARHWYAADRAAPAWEPGGEDFLSPTLIEALCMRAVLPAAAFGKWFSSFLPEIAAARPATLFAPVRVSDRSDGKIAHLDGLNLSRAWCWRELAAAPAVDTAVQGVARAAAQRHLEAALAHLEDDYAGAHWLATFALLAVDGLDAGEPASPSQ